MQYIDPPSAAISDSDHRRQRAQADAVVQRPRRGAARKQRLLLPQRVRKQVSHFYGALYPESEEFNGANDGFGV
jgi:hypothetical protein